MTTVVFAPHEDDEALACGGSLIKRVRAGEPVREVFMTDGRNSHAFALDISEDPSPQEVAVLRRGEALEVAEALGVGGGNVLFLTFEDMFMDKNVPAATKQVVELLGELEPDTVYVPFRGDLHPDHAATNQAVLAALRKLHMPAEVLEYPVWLGDEGDFRPARRAERLVEVDVSDVLGAKRDAIALYRSQVALAFPSQTRPVLEGDFVARFTGPTERFISYRVGGR